MGVCIGTRLSGPDIGVPKHTELEPDHQLASRNGKPAQTAASRLRFAAGYAKLSRR